MARPGRDEGTRPRGQAGEGGIQACRDTGGAAAPARDRPVGNRPPGRAAPGLNGLCFPTARHSGASRNPGRGWRRCSIDPGVGRPALYGHDMHNPLDSGFRRAATGILPSTAGSRRGLPPASMQASRRIPDVLSIAATGILDGLFPTPSTTCIHAGVPSRRIQDFLSIAATGILPSRRIQDILSINDDEVVDAPRPPLSS